MLKLVLVMTATNAVSERCASALRRIKSNLRATMQQDRLNSLMILQIHKERTDTLSYLIVHERIYCKTGAQTSIIRNIFNTKWKFVRESCMYWLMRITIASSN